MKNQKKEPAKQNVEKTTKKREVKLFFLYAKGKGFIRLHDYNGPQFEDGELATFTSRIEAKHARNFFVMMKVAEEIDIMAKVG